MEIEIKVVDSYNMIDKQYWKRMGKFYAENVWTKTGIKTAEENVKFSFSSFEYEYAVKWFELMAYIGKEPVGLMRVLRNPDDDTRWFFCDVHTALKYRHQGVASIMYRKAIELVKEYEAAERIIASVSASNGNSIGLHNKMGFVDTGREPGFANFTFEEDETEYELTIYNEYPAVDSDVHRKILTKLYKKYLQSNGNEVSKNVSGRIRQMLKNHSENESVKLNIIWNGNNPVGFEYETDSQKCRFIE